MGVWQEFGHRGVRETVEPVSEFDDHGFEVPLIAQHRHAIFSQLLTAGLVAGCEQVRALVSVDRTDQVRKEPSHDEQLVGERPAAAYIAYAIAPAVLARIDQHPLDASPMRMVTLQEVRRGNFEAAMLEEQVLIIDIPEDPVDTQEMRHEGLLHAARAPSESDAETAERRSTSGPRWRSASQPLEALSRCRYPVVVAGHELLFIGPTERCELRFDSHLMRVLAIQNHLLSDEIHEECWVLARAHPLGVVRGASRLGQGFERRVEFVLPDLVDRRCHDGVASLCMPPTFPITEHIPDQGVVVENGVLDASQEIPGLRPG